MLTMVLLGLKLKLHFVERNNCLIRTSGVQLRSWSLLHIEFS